MTFRAWTSIFWPFRFINVGPRGRCALWEKLLGQKPHEEDEADQSSHLLSWAVQQSPIQHIIPIPFCFRRIGLRQEFRITHSDCLRSSRPIPAADWNGQDKGTCDRPGTIFSAGSVMKRYGDTGWFRIIGPQDASKEAEFNLRSQTAECIGDSRRA